MESFVRLIQSQTEQAIRETGLPQANVTGPCQIQSSILCTGEGIQRMNPLDMLARDTSFQGYASCCLPCYEANADEFVRVTHGRA